MMNAVLHQGRTTQNFVKLSNHQALISCVNHNLRPTSTPHLPMNTVSPAARICPRKNKHSPSTLSLDLFPAAHSDTFVPPTSLFPRSVAKAGQGRAPVQDLQRGLERVHRVARTLDGGRSVTDAARGEDAMERGWDGETETCWVGVGSERAVAIGCRLRNRKSKKPM